MPWYVRGRQCDNGNKLLWEKTLQGNLSIWRRIDGKLVQIGTWAFNETRNNDKKNPTMDENGITTITPGFQVTKNDFIGITLPPSTQRSPTQRAIINQHLPILMIQQWIPDGTCMSGNNMSFTSSCYMPQRPNALLQIEFQPENMGSTSKSEVLVQVFLATKYVHIKYVRYIIHIYSTCIY